MKFEMWIFSVLSLCFLSCSSITNKQIKNESGKKYLLKNYTKRLNKDRHFYSLGRFDYHKRKDSSYERRKDFWQYRDRFSIGPDTQSYTQPVYLEDKDQVLLSIIGKGLSLRDLKTGAEIWTYEIALGVAARALVKDDFVYFAALDGVLRKVQLADAKLVWEKDLKTPSFGAIIDIGHSIVLTASDNSVWAINPSDASVNWRYRRPAGSKGFKWVLREDSYPLTVLDGKMISVGFSDGFFVALQGINGATAWEQDFNKSGKFQDSDWKHQVFDGGSKILLTLSEGNTVILDAASGNVLKRFKGPSFSSSIKDVESADIYQSLSDKSLVKKTPQGNVLWMKDLREFGHVSQMVSMNKDRLAVLTNSYGLLLLNSATGEILDDDFLGEGLVSELGFDGKRLFFLGPYNSFHSYNVKLN